MTAKRLFVEIYSILSNITQINIDKTTKQSIKKIITFALQSHYRSGKTIINCTILIDLDDLM